MAERQIIREPSHAGSWYSSSKTQLDSQLAAWLGAVQTPVKCIGPLSKDQSVDELPVTGARVIIAPYVTDHERPNGEECSMLKYNLDTLDMRILDQLLHGRIKPGT